MRILKLALLFSVVLVTSEVSAAVVGVFTQTSGEVRLLRGENYLETEPGAEVESQDIIEADADSSAQIDMDDGSVLMLGPQSRLVFSEYRLDPNKTVFSANLDLLTGWLHFAVAKLKPDGVYVLGTPVFTIGVRGTEGALETESDASALYLQEGEVEVSAIVKNNNGIAPIRIRGGEYLHRQRGLAFKKSVSPPADFFNRMPPDLQHKLARRALKPQQRGISPRIIRAVTRDEAQHYLKNYPDLSEKLQQRFQTLVGPAARDAAKTEPEAAAIRTDSATSPGAAETLIKSPTIRELPLPKPADSGQMQRVPAPTSPSPLQNVPALQNSPRSP